MVLKILQLQGILPKDLMMNALKSLFIAKNIECLWTLVEQNDDFLEDEMKGINRYQ